MLIIEFLAELDREVDTRLAWADAEAAARLVAANEDAATIVNRARATVSKLLAEARSAAAAFQRAQALHALHAADLLERARRDATDSIRDTKREPSGLLAAVPEPSETSPRAARAPLPHPARHEQRPTPSGERPAGRPDPIDSDHRRPRVDPERTIGNRQHKRWRTPSRTVVVWSLVFVGVVLTTAQMIRTFVAAPYSVASNSMEPEIHDGDRMVVNKLAYEFGEPGRGDIVLFESQNVPGAAAFTDATLVKRVVALPGEVVWAADGRLFVDNQPIDEPWASGLTPTFVRVTVPDRAVFVLGDNRQISLDSRSFGVVPIDAIEGRVDFVIWPANNAGSV